MGGGIGLGTHPIHRNEYLEAQGATVRLKRVRSKRERYRGRGIGDDEQLETLCVEVREIRRL
jgi:hypothetical protein